MIAHCFFIVCFFSGGITADNSRLTPAWEQQRTPLVLNNMIDKLNDRVTKQQNRAGFWTMPVLLKISTCSLQLSLGNELTAIYLHRCSFSCLEKPWQIQRIELCQKYNFQLFNNIYSKYNIGFLEARRKQTMLLHTVKFKNTVVSYISRWLPYTVSS